MSIDKYRPFIKVFEDNHGILKVARAIQLGIPKHVVYDMYSKGILKKKKRDYIDCQVRNH